MIFFCFIISSMGLLRVGPLQSAPKGLWTPHHAMDSEKKSDKFGEKQSRSTVVMLHI